MVFFLEQDEVKSLHFSLERGVAVPADLMHVRKIYSAFLRVLLHRKHPFLASLPSFSAFRSSSSKYRENARMSGQGVSVDYPRISVPAKDSLRGHSPGLKQNKESDKLF